MKTVKHMYITNHIPNSLAAALTSSKDMSGLQCLFTAKLCSGLARWNLVQGFTRCCKRVMENMHKQVPSALSDIWVGDAFPEDNAKSESLSNAATIATVCKSYSLHLEWKGTWNTSSRGSVSSHNELLFLPFFMYILFTVQY